MAEDENLKRITPSPELITSVEFVQISNKRRLSEYGKTFPDHHQDPGDQLREALTQIRTDAPPFDASEKKSGVGGVTVEDLSAGIKQLLFTDSTPRIRRRERIRLPVAERRIALRLSAGRSPPARRRLAFEGVAARPAVKRLRSCG